MTRPLLRYHGGKFQIAPWIISHFPSHKIYTECYGGGGSVLLRKPRVHTEVYNDLDGEIVNVFRQARDAGTQLEAMLRLTPYSREEYDLSWEPTGDKLEQARRTIVRSFAGFSSASVTLMGNRGKTGFRCYNMLGGAAPAKDWANYPDAFVGLVSRLRGVAIENRPAIDVIRCSDGPHTLHYVDPPYLPAVRDKGKDYRFEMSVEDHVELLEFLRGVEGKVVLSGYDSDLYNEVLRGWSTATRPVTTQGKAKRVEKLWMNYDGNTQGELF